MKILLVEDDISLRQFLSTTMAAYRYSVDIATDGDTGLELASQGKYCAILLGMMVPSMDGLSICRKLRHQGCQTPILILTAKDSDEDVVAGLDAGADDCVTKPLKPSQLIARIRALMRRTGNPISPILTWGELCLNPTLIQVTYQQQVVALSPKEYSLLELFLRHPQRLFSRSAIIDHLWSIDEFPTDAAVTNLVKDLRRRLRTVGMMEELIETVYRLGYRLKPAPKKEKKENKICQEQEELVPIEEVKQNFQASLEKRVEVLEQSLKLQQEQVRDEAHRLADGLGTFGYTKRSDFARAIEYLFMEES